MIKQWLRSWWYWVRSRYAPQNAFVRCETCPHWRFHSRVEERVASLRYRAGVCALERPKVFNDFTTGLAFKCWTATDWCRHHPLYDSRPVQGSDLQYRPGPDTLNAAGFDRLPSFREAVALALKNSDGSVIIAQAPDQAPVKDGPNAPAKNDDNAS